jgi:Bacterial SH3 domain/FecR protein
MTKRVSLVRLIVQFSHGKNTVFTKRALIALCFMLGFSGVIYVQAQQSNRVARVQVISPGVEIRRVGTEKWLPIRAESLFGVGDSLRTVGQGVAEIRFYEGVNTIRISPETTVALEVFTGQNDALSYNIEMALITGNIRSAVRRASNDDEIFKVITPHFAATLIQGESVIGLTDKTTTLLVANTGQVLVQRENGQSATVTASFGIRGRTNQPLSEVVPARDFATLTVALDGCPSTVSLTDDVQLNVRLGADTSYPRVGGINNDDPVQVIGLTANRVWFRIFYKGGFAWIRPVERLTLAQNCQGLRVFPERFGPESVGRFTEPVEVSTLVAPTATPTP